MSPTQLACLSRLRHDRFDPSYSVGKKRLLDPGQASIGHNYDGVLLSQLQVLSNTMCLRGRIKSDQSSAITVKAKVKSLVSSFCRNAGGPP